jgi:uncharacterized membrane protein
MADDSYVLPNYVEDTIHTIAKLHTDHDSSATRLLRFIKLAIDQISKPTFLLILTIFLFLWIGSNYFLISVGLKAWDPPPFYWLQTSLSMFAVYITILILAAQRHDDELSKHREQLALQLAILSEQKAAKIIALLEEMRTEHPHLSNRIDHEAISMSIVTDTQTVLEAIRDKNETVVF